MHAYGMGERMMHIEKFTEYLAREKKMAKNSLDAYRRDVKEFADFEAARGISDLQHRGGGVSAQSQTRGEVRSHN